MNNKKWEGWNSPDDNNQLYVDVCYQASVDDDVFSKFKSIQAYKNVLEHVSTDQGRYYLSIIEQMTDSLGENLEAFKENDKYGQPMLGNFPAIGSISPTTLRYIKNTFDMASLVKETPISKIVEVGGGYGGLCKTLSVVCDFDEYVLIDLPEVVKLQDKYLSNFPDLYKKCVFVPCTESKEIKDIDLFISNYALSECDDETQTMYFDDLISNSKFAYLVYNVVNFREYKLENFIKKLEEIFTVTTSEDLENIVLYSKK